MSSKKYLTRSTQHPTSIFSQEKRSAACNVGKINDGEFFSGAFDSEAGDTPTPVPSRFLVNDEEHVPVIDMQELLSGDFMDSELGKLDRAWKE